MYTCLNFLGYLVIQVQFVLRFTLLQFTTRLGNSHCTRTVSERITWLWGYLIAAKVGAEPLGLSDRQHLEGRDMRVANRVCDPIRQSLVNSSEDGELPSLDFVAPDLAYVARKVLNIGLTLSVVPDLAPEGAWLFKVELSNLAQIAPSTTNKVLVAGLSPAVAGGGIDGALTSSVGKGLDGALVVGAASLRDKGLGSIALEVGDGDDGSVNGQLLVIGAQAVAVGIGVGEEAGLQDGIGGGLDVRDEMGRREGGLFDLGEVVLGILVENKLSDGSERVLAVGPDFGEIENVVSEFLRLVGGHSLNIDLPGGGFSRLDGLKQGLSTMVGVLSGDFGSGGSIEGLKATVNAQVDLDVDEASIILEPLESMARISVLLMVAIRSAAV